jgi:uncharacterized protein YegP (UPF0339 family)
MHIEITKGKRKYSWKIVGRNGETVVTSQGYYSKWSAKRSALKLANINRMRIVDAVR